MLHLYITIVDIGWLIKLLQLFNTSVPPCVDESVQLAVLPVRHGREWLSWKTGAQGERQATTELLFPRVTLVYMKNNTNTQLSLSNPKGLSKLLYVCVVIRGTYSVECEL